MEKVINLGIPHVGELIFKSMETPQLFQCAMVSETWRELAENVLAKRLKGKMFEACKNGETKIVQLLLERYNSEDNGLNIKYQFGLTPFSWACKQGHKAVVQLLLDYSGTELNARNSNNREQTAFMLACVNGHKDVVKLLLEQSKRIDLNARSKHGFTGFLYACRHGYKELIQLLLDHSNIIDLDARTNDGKTAIMLASLDGYKESVQLILAHSDINLNTRNDAGRTALMDARQ